MGTSSVKLDGTSWYLFRTCMYVLPGFLSDVRVWNIPSFARDLSIRIDFGVVKYMFGELAVIPCPYFSIRDGWLYMDWIRLYKALVEDASCLTSAQLDCGEVMFFYYDLTGMEHFFSVRFDRLLGLCGIPDEEYLKLRMFARAA